MIEIVFIDKNESFWSEFAMNSNGYREKKKKTKKKKTTKKKTKQKKQNKKQTNITR